MEKLPIELRLKILKYLNFDDLHSTKQTCRYLRNLIVKYEDELIRKRHDKLSIIECKEYMPNSVVFDLPLTKHLMDKIKIYTSYEVCNDLTYKKWQSAIGRQIPLYLIVNEKLSPLNKKVALKIETLKEGTLILHLPLYPKSIEYLKIIRYWLKKIVRCVFNSIDFKDCIFNPEIIQLLFNTEEIKKFKFNVNSIKLFYQNTNLFKFTADYLIINNIFHLYCNQYDNTREFNFLLNILLNEGNNIPEVHIHQPNNNFAIFCNQILNHIETSNECSKVVPKIQFISTKWPNLYVKGIEKNSNLTNNTKEYEITNIYNSNLKFSLNVSYNIFQGRVINQVKINRIIN